MTTKVRKQIYIDAGQNVLIKWLAKSIGITEAEIIRQAIDRHTRSFQFPKRDLTAWQAERTFIAQLMQQGPIPGRRTWRREDLHER
jgi:hypothetical protein